MFFFKYENIYFSILMAKLILPKKVPMVLLIDMINNTWGNVMFDWFQDSMTELNKDITKLLLEYATNDL